MSILKGWFGEKKTSLKMWLTLDKGTYPRFHNTILPSSNGTTQIDHILVSSFGIFIVETKNKSGWIFGSEKKASWTQTFYSKKYSFQNPLRQTYRQKKILAQFLSINESIIHPIIYFVGDCKIKTPLPLNVITSGLGRYIKGFTETKLTIEERNGIIKKIEQHNIHSTLSNKDHIESLKSRHHSTTACPSCGSSLKIKTAKKGSRAGKQFLGCERYPHCKFSKSMN